MTGAELRKKAAEYIIRIFHKNSYLNIILTNINSSKELKFQEKGYLTETLTGIVIWKNKLDWIISEYSNIPLKKLENLVYSYLLLGFYDLAIKEDLPDYAAVDQVVQAAKGEKGKKAAGFINAVFRSYLRDRSKPSAELEILKTKDKTKYISILHSHPEWMIKRWLGRYGFENTVKLCEWNNSKPERTIKINAAIKDHNIFVEYLFEKNFVKREYSDEFYIYHVNNLQKLIHSDWFGKGYFIIQSASSTLPVIALGLKDGDSVLDICSAPGGKTAFISELIGNKGKVTAVDLKPGRLRLVKENVKRLGLKNIKTVCEDGTKFITEEKYDKILIDAPCSGFGSINRKPDIKWKRRSGDLSDLSGIQTDLLQNSSGLVKPGGSIIYSTCTIEPEENEQIIENFLGQNGNFEPEEIEKFDKFGFGKPSIITTLPFLHNLDGSFIAK
ncbi:16S rRNA (cytosine(967)-C(5))-methyltransferase RsmB, partial [candidate division KSB1 bacterium]